MCLRMSETIMDEDVPCERNLYLVVANEGRFAMLYCATPGWDGRVRQGYSSYFSPDCEVFVLGAAAAIVPMGKVGMLDPIPGYMLDSFRGLPPGEPTEILNQDLPGMRKPKPKRKRKES
jgi:hypothetical protein